MIVKASRNHRVRSIPNVLLLLPLETAYGRGLFRGISQYVQLHGPWSIDSSMPASGRRKSFLASYKKETDFDGIITSETHPVLKKTIETYKIPAAAPLTVINSNVNNTATITSDHRAVGRSAAEHLLGLNLKHFAYAGMFGTPWNIVRAENFEQKIVEAGFTVHNYPIPPSNIRQYWEKEKPYLVEWLKSLPKPLGIMCANDVRAKDISEACKLAKMRVPDEVALIGVDNDEFICDLAEPPISSIPLNFERAGYEVAEWLDSVMAGKKIAHRTIVIHPQPVVVRQSTDILKISDMEVAKAVQFIRLHANNLISVREVADEVGLSPRRLQERFSKVLSTTISDEIRRVRIRKIEQMLVETNLSITQIAESLGYSTSAHISRYFKKETGHSLLQHRREIGKI